MKEATGLSDKVLLLLAREPRSFETVATAFDLIEHSVLPIGGIAAVGVVLPDQLERFRTSLNWRPESKGRRMTLSEAYAFVERLARALEVAAAKPGTVKRGRPVSAR